MEAKKDVTTRKFRGQAAIRQLLREQIESGQTIRSFCADRGIAAGNFHRWKQQYSAAEVSSPEGFTKLQLIGTAGLFAAVGEIKLYQPVSASYLKELAS